MSKMARAAGLFYINTSQVDDIQSMCTRSKTRFCNLFTFYEGTITFEAPNANTAPTEPETNITNKANIQLLLWETPDMNPFDPQLLELEIKTTLNITSPETLTQKTNLPWTYPSKNTTRSETRRSPFDFPSFPFLQKIPTLLPDNKYSTLESHNQLAATMGILPTKLRKALDYHGHEWDQDHIDSPRIIIERISSTLLHTTTVIYQKYLKWYRQEHFGDYEP